MFTDNSLQSMANERIVAGREPEPDQGEARGSGPDLTMVGPGPRPGPHSAAVAIRPLVEAVLGPEPRVRFELWDGSTLGPADGAGPLRIRSADAIRRLLWSPDELGLGRAFVTGEVDVDGDFFGLLEALRPAARRDVRLSFKALPAAVRAASRLGALRGPLKPPAEETRPVGWRHSKRRDARAISHHYDVGNDFYRLVLGPSMTYSCARFRDPAMTLEQAQEAKHELICRKLGLHERPGLRLLDVGCGWGSMAMHAAARHHATVVGVTISRAQAELARRRVAEAGLSGLVEIRTQDYRDVRGETFDAISSIGMFEHVGTVRMAEYFQTLRALLRPQGRLLNHAISSPQGSRLGRRSFMNRYVFPDGELLDVGDVALAMQRAGFELRDVESLREHYARTLRSWVANLEGSWDTAVAQVGPARARVWRLYMAASAIGFEDGGVAIHQVLGVVPDGMGRSGMPATREDWR
jgi:cyclopropane-fatty-acyl-phospholipid synthase